MKVITIPCNFDNYGYLIVCEETGETAVVDPAEFYPVYKVLKDNELALTSVYCTHHHADHIGGLDDLLDEFGDLVVCGSNLDKDRIPGLNTPLKNNGSFTIGNIRGNILFTPGHTKGSACYSFEGHLFTGDTLFSGGCGRVFEGTPAEMYESINVKIKSFPMGTKIYFGHEYTAQNLKFGQFVEPGNVTIQNQIDEMVSRSEQGMQITSPTTLELECSINPFLRCADEELLESVRKKFVIDRLDPVSVFTAIRGLKDNF